MEINNSKVKTKILKELPNDLNLKLFIHTFHNWISIEFAFESLEELGLILPWIMEFGLLGHPNSNLSFLTLETRVAHPPEFQFLLPGLILACFHPWNSGCHATQILGLQMCTPCFMEFGWPCHPNSRLASLRVLGLLVLFLGSNQCELICAIFFDLLGSSCAWFESLWLQFLNLCLNLFWWKLDKACWATRIPILV